jgi:hypothetical protein
MIQALPDLDAFKLFMPGAALPGACAENGQSVDDPRWQQLIEELRGFEHLGDDWDGLGAKPPAPALVASSVSLAHQLRQVHVRPPSRVVPGLDGTILFEWQQDGVFLELEVTQPGQAEWMQILPSRAAQHGEMSFASDSPVSPW